MEPNSNKVIEDAPTSLDVSNPPAPPVWGTIGQWLAAASSLLYVLSRVVPYRPPAPGAVLDYSFPQVLHEGFARHWQFGRDVIYTYGPWGFLATGFLPANHALYVTVWTLLAVLFWWVGWRVAGQLSGNPLTRWLWLILFVGLPGENNMDYLGWIALFCFFHFFVEQRSFMAVHALMGIAFGVLALIKFNLFLMTVIVVGTVAADTVFRHRRRPWIAAFFAGSFFALWFAAGQHLSTLGPYFLNSWRSAAGFAEAMMLSSKWEIQEIMFFVLAAVWLCAGVGALTWARHRDRGILLLAGMLAILFLVFKYSFVRHDVHAESAPLGFFLLFMLALAAGRPVMGDKGRWISALTLLPVIAVVGWAGLARARYSQTNLLSDFTQTFSIRNVSEPLNLLLGSQRMRIEYAKTYDAFRAEYPIPPLEGTADEYSYNQVALFANGIRYQLRPVFQSFSAYTPELAGLNAAHLRSQRAADNILLDLLSIDDRFPSLEDGLSWPEILTRYDLQAVAPPFVLMKRSPNPRAWSLEPLGEASIGFGQRYTLPVAASGPVWAKIEINKSLSGSVISTLYKPPSLTISVMTRDGTRERYRLVPGMARAGFLLSPVVGDIHAFGLLASRNGQQQLAGREVAALAITADNSSGTTTLYQSPMRLQLFRLDFPKQDSTGTMGRDELKKQ